MELIPTIQFLNIMSQYMLACVWGYNNVQLFHDNILHKDKIIFNI